MENVHPYYPKSFDKVAKLISFLNITSHEYMLRQTRHPVWIMNLHKQTFPTLFDCLPDNWNFLFSTIAHHNFIRALEWYCHHIKSFWRWLEFSWCPQYGVQYSHLLCVLRSANKCKRSLSCMVNPNGTGLI